MGDFRREEKAPRRMIINAVGIVLGISLVTSLPYPNPREYHSVYWTHSGHAQLVNNLNRPISDKPAKNVILFIGDGMGFPVITGSRIFRGQSEGRASDQDPFTFEKFPFTGISRTHSLDKHVTDSSCSATAFLAGVKAPQKTVGLGPESKVGDCESVNKHSVDSIAAWAIREGKGAGVVTTTRVTHATPAALYGHAASREWEDDKMMDLCRQRLHQNTANCSDLALQLLTRFPGNQLKVILGGGRRKFDRKGRLDGRNLIEEWRNLTGNRSYVHTRNQLRDLDFDKAENLLGLFAESHLEYELNRESDSTEPTIVDMTQAALKMMKKEKNGYFLLVEGGRIDQSLHFNRPKAAFTETIWLDKAITFALENTDPEETLIVVTADHSHVMDIMGYPSRNTSILGYEKDYLPSLWPQFSMVNNGTVPIITFANGPSSINKTERIPRVESVDTDSNDYATPSFIPRHLETHGGEDVPVYATGPQSHLFSGTQDNTFLPHAMSYALCIGPSKPICDIMKKKLDPDSRTAYSFFTQITRFFGIKD